MRVRIFAFLLLKLSFPSEEQGGRVVDRSMTRMIELDSWYWHTVDAGVRKCNE
jgi:hypothetical protein